MKGTYKRDFEGDFLCTEEAVRAMFADQRDASGDIEVIDEMGLDVLKQDTIKGYCIIFEQLYSGHPWNALENDEFLMKLRAVAKNKNGLLSPYDSRTFVLWRSISHYGNFPELFFGL